VIIATDLAEFIGAALGLYLLFGIPLLESSIIAAIGSFAILELQRRGYRSLEAGIAGMLFVVVIAFALQTFFAKPDVGSVMKGLFIPTFQGTDSVLLAAGILGATVMPHAIYLHSALTQRRVVGTTDAERKKIFRFEFIDILIAMLIAGAINASMLIVAAALFFKNGLYVEDLDVAFDQFGSLVSPISAVLFGIGLLIAGLSSSSVGTLSGDVIMQGFIRYRIPLYVRRFITIIPPIIIIASGVNPTSALVLSQVVLSFGIAFALIPLIMFTSNKRIMGSLINAKWVTMISWVIAVLIVALNIFLIVDTLR
jgi:manganese transport protein